MKRDHGTRVRAGVQGRVVRRATPPAAPATTHTLMSPATTQADHAVADGMQQHRAGRLAEAEACYRRALAEQPTHPEALHLLGLLAHQCGRHDLAVDLIGRAIASASDRPLYYLNLGATLQALGRLDLAAERYQQAIALQPDSAQAHNNLGVALQAQGALTDAILSFERAITLAPGYPDAHFNLGVARQAEGRNDLALASYQGALALRPDHLGARYNLGNAQRELRQLSEAAASYRAVLDLDPSHVDAHNNLGTVLQELQDEDGAIACFERTIALQPGYRNAHVNLGHLRRQGGQFAEAIESYRRALALQPDDDHAHGAIILAMDHLSGCTPEQAFVERRAWNAAHAAHLTAAAPPHTNDPDPDRPLRVGYVSSYFYWNSNAFALAPILAHDPRQVEAVCYADVAEPDHHTAAFANGVSLFRNVFDVGPDALVEQVRADRLDILVDLDGHSGASRHRLLAFAQKPAPVQVTAWGYPTGTGLDAIDAIFSDPVCIPPDEQRWFAEEVVYLPSVMYVQPPAQPPDVAPAPCIANGAVTFGSFNQPMKLSAEVLDTWASILVKVPGSRMVLKYTGLDDPESLARIQAAFAARGVRPERVDVVGKTTRYDHLAAYGRIDVQLDPFPHGGGVTTFEGLLMGVPCVTLLGDRISGRVSASFVTALGLEDLVARTLDEYVEIAVHTAGQHDRLAQERATLRARLLASPIADLDQYTRAAEAAYRALWRRWCAGQAAGLSRQPSSV